MKWIIKKETVSTEYLPLKRLNIMEGDNIVTRLTDKDENSKVNANLIASAPDTYKVAKEVVDYIETNGIDKWSDKEKEGLFVWGLYKYYAKDAVAKAEGK